MSTTAAAAKPAPSMVQRMTSIMEAFDGRATRRSLEDVAAITGLPRSTTHRILDQLVTIGWLVHSTTGYALGWRTQRYEAGSSRHDLLREVAAPALHELAMRTGLVVHLAVLEGPTVRYLDKVGGASLPTVPSRVGGRIPAERTAVGRACLAYLAPEEVDTIMRQQGPDGVGDRPDLGRLHRELAEIRNRDGVARHVGEGRGVACVGSALRAESTGVRAGISLCDVTKQQNLAQFVPLLADRTRMVSARLARSVGGPVPVSA